MLYKECSEVVKRVELEKVSEEESGVSSADSGESSDDRIFIISKFPINQSPQL